MERFKRHPTNKTWANKKYLSGVNVPKELFEGGQWSVL